jgi:hypothetical protein
MLPSEFLPFRTFLPCVSVPILPSSFESARVNTSFRENQSSRPQSLHARLSVQIPVPCLHADKPSFSANPFSLQQPPSVNILLPCKVMFWWSAPPCPPACRRIGPVGDNDRFHGESVEETNNHADSVVKALFFCCADQTWSQRMNSLWCSHGRTSWKSFWRAWASLNVVASRAEGLIAIWRGSVDRQCWEGKTPHPGLSRDPSRKPSNVQSNSCEDCLAEAEMRRRSSGCFNIFGGDDRGRRAF